LENDAEKPPVKIQAAFVLWLLPVYLKLREAWRYRGLVRINSPASSLPDSPEV